MNVSRIRYMGEKGESIPYQQVEYLESNGNQVIDTSFILNNTVLSIDVKIVPLEETTTKFFFGNRFVSSGIYLGPSGSVMVFGFFSSSNTSVYNLTYVNKEISFKYNGTDITITNETDGVSNIYTPHITSDETLPFRIFSNSTVNPSRYGSKMRFLEAKVIMPSGAINLIPVRIGQVGYVYDTISGQLFGNAGTGNFTLGPDIN